MALKPYWKSLSIDDRRGLAERCGTTPGHLSNVAYGSRPCSPELAVSLEKESGGKVTCEQLCPSVDWAFLRSSRHSSKSTTRRAG